MAHIENPEAAWRGAASPRGPAKFQSRMLWRSLDRPRTCVKGVGSVGRNLPFLGEGVTWRGGGAGPRLDGVYKV